MTTSDQHSPTTPTPTTPTHNSAPASSTGPKPRIADTIYYRHPCDCPTASRPLQPGEHPEHRFDVDGQPFPWLNTSVGATFTHDNGIYLAHITLIPIRKDTGRPVIITIDPDLPSLLLDGQPFPWLIADDGITVEWMHNFYPLLTFDFFAHHVDTDTEIPITVRRWLPGDNQP